MTENEQDNIEEREEDQAESSQEETAPADSPATEAPADEAQAKEPKQQAAKTEDSGSSHTTSRSRSSSSERSERSHDRQDRRSAGATTGGVGPISEAPKVVALEVSVDHSIDRALKVLKRKLIKEGLFKELKLRRYYEKPSERKKRKLKESMKKIRKEESRLKRSTYL